MRDAIIYSLLTWESFNVSERIALALAHLGVRVLYCEHPASVLRKAQSRWRELGKGITAFRPACLADRLNKAPLLGPLQARFLAKQILSAADTLRLRRPIFFYPWMGSHVTLLDPLRGKFTFVHIEMDYGESDLERHVQASDITLTIPRSAYHQQRGQFGEKIKRVPQVVDLCGYQAAGNGSLTASPLLSSIPHPRLGYLGPAFQRLSKPILSQVLRKHPEWQFISVDREKILPLPNVHVLPWRSGRDLASYVAGFDLGFMPYDCLTGHNLHCLPLKLFDYFALGLPVVSTPLIELWDLGDLVYVGDTAEELGNAVTLALQEPHNSPKRQRRRDITSTHSIESLADALKRALPLDG